MRRVVRGIDRRRVSVVLLDPSSDVRSAIRSALEEGGRFQVVGEAGADASGLALVQACAPDLVLLDLTQPGSEGLETVRRLREEAPRSAVVLRGASRPTSEVESAVGLGALGVVRSGAPLREVADQVATLFAERRTVAGVR